jgi:hypothetical protein
VKSSFEPSNFLHKKFHILCFCQVDNRIIQTKVIIYEPPIKLIKMGRVMMIVAKALIHEAVSKMSNAALADVDAMHILEDYLPSSVKTIIDLKQQSPKTIFKSVELELDSKIACWGGADIEKSIIDAKDAVTILDLSKFLKVNLNDISMISDTKLWVCKKHNPISGTDRKTGLKKRFSTWMSK